MAHRSCAELKFERSFSDEKLVALLLVLTMAFAFAACGGNKDNGETTTAASDETTAADTDVTAASEDANATVAPDASEPTSDVTAATEESTAPETTANVAELVAPTATADILNIYNNAVNSAYNARAGFKRPARPTTKCWTQA